MSGPGFKSHTSSENLCISCEASLRNALNAEARSGAGDFLASSNE